MMYRIDNPMKSRSFAAHPASCASPALRRKAAANETWRWKKQKNNYENPDTLVYQMHQIYVIQWPWWTVKIQNRPRYMVIQNSW